eukprot:TRINITY_DN3142_c0_g4_i2.p1 TRINITY_DN3142_c0_g4~~TRINITY_DN3142_c0_g4_i2.p1  ORF type:complete len:465 (-),score=34.06 TRINITY_DN3142_c0_g4_i2:733-2127(-)
MDQRQLVNLSIVETNLHHKASKDQQLCPSLLRHSFQRSCNDSMLSLCESNCGNEDSCLLLQIQPSELLGQDAKPNNISKSFRPETLKGYKLGQKIGQGGFGKVLLGWHKFSGRTVAVKVIEKSMLVYKEDQSRVQWEVSALQLLHHPNVLRLLEVVDSRSQLYMVTEHVPGGSLIDVLKQEGPLYEDRAARYITQIVLALMHCHKQGVVHRDIKLDNLLLDPINDQIKLIDFGLSGAWKPGLVLNKYWGTASYAAPEIHQHKEYGPLVDVWSLGVVMFALLTGTLPFREPNQFYKIVEGSLMVPGFVSECAGDLIRKMLTVDPNQRIDLQSILEHPWIQPILMNERVYNKNDAFYQEFLQDQEHGLMCPLSFIIELQERYGFDGSQIRKDIAENRCSGGSAAYFLLLQNLKDKYRELEKQYLLSGLGYKINLVHQCIAPIGLVKDEVLIKDSQSDYVPHRFCEK